MPFPDLPPELADRLARLERVLGRRLSPRLVHASDPDLRGRLHDAGPAIVLDVNDVNPGYFWHLDVLRSLLDHLESCEAQAGGPTLPWELR